MTIPDNSNIQFVSIKIYNIKILFNEEFRMGLKKSITLNFLKFYQNFLKQANMI